MLANKLRLWAGTGLLSLLGAIPLYAQAPALLPPPSSPAPVSTNVPPPSVPAQSVGAPGMPLGGFPSAAMPIDTPTPPAQNSCNITPDSHSCCQGGGLWMDGEYMLLQARRNAFDYAINSPNTTQFPGGSVDDLHYDDRSAFRFGMGYQLPNSGWSLGVHWTYFHTAANDSDSASANGALYATMTRAGTFDQVATAAASSSLNYSVIDIEASKHLAVSDVVDINISGGVRIAWIDQTLGAIYNGGPSGASNATVDSPTYFSGGGLTAAAETEWKIYRGFGIYGTVRASLLEGQFRNFYNESNNAYQTSIVSVSETYRQLVPVLELGVGVSWQTEHVRLKIGYDMANWFNMVNSIDFSDPTDIGNLSRRTSDLMLEGLTVQAAFMF